jgi:hypothetical protein
LKTAIPLVLMTLLSAALALFLWPGSSCANTGYQLLTHLLPHESRTCSENLPAIESYDDVVSTYHGCGHIDFFIVIFQSDGMKDLQFALNWPGEWGSCVFTCCSDMVLGDIVNPGDDVLLTWHDCQEDPVIIPCYCRFTANTSGFIDLVEGPGGPTLIWDCHSAEVEPNFGLDAYVDCGSAAKSTTWGRIRAMFR